MRRREVVLVRGELDGRECRALGRRGGPRGVGARHRHVREAGEYVDVARGGRLRGAALDRQLAQRGVGHDS